MEPTSWDACHTIWEGSRRRKLANNTYLERSGREEILYHVRLHSTRVVTFHPNGNVWLDSGGWRTVTTKERFNRYLPDGFGVWSDGGVWYLGRSGDDPVAYADGITISADGSVSGFGPDPNETKRLRRKVLKYATEYAAAFVAGKVPAPNNGDCWGCLLVNQADKQNPRSGIGGSDHFLSHLDEKYYVPSLLSRAAQRFGSRALLHDVATVWQFGADTDQPRFFRPDMLTTEVRRVVRRWVLAGVELSS